MPAFTPREIHRLFEDAFNARDLEAILALYEPGAVFIAAGEPVTGHKAIRCAYQTSLAPGARMQVCTTEVIETEGLALLHAAWTLGPPACTEGLSTEVVRRQPNGSWLFIIDNPHTKR